MQGSAAWSRQVYALAAVLHRRSGLTHRTYAVAPHEAVSYGYILWYDVYWAVFCWDVQTICAGAQLCRTRQYNTRASSIPTQRASSA